MNTSSYIDSYEEPLARLHAEEITFVDFLKEVDCHSQFVDWCKKSHLAPDEGAAQLFFDHHGFDESSVVKEIIEPVV